MKRDCPKGEKKDRDLPTTHAMPDVQGNTTEDPRMRQLFKSWGKLENQNALFLFDPGSTDNFISQEMADALKLQLEDYGAPMEANSAFKEGAAKVTPIIGKLRMKIGDYQDRGVPCDSTGYGLRCLAGHAMALLCGSNSKF